MSNIVSIADGQAIDPNGNVVAMLEGLLARARAGDVVAVAYACVRPDGTTGTAYEDGVMGIPLVAAAAILAHRIAGDFQG